ncbi:MAG TPA: hypothetical protein DER33_02865 [Syntrophomonas sp.]|nr:hypothetical protein [Syntrophomonas sp.]HCF70526.1 hypothetical protein [Syntrophomonas sp.]
MQPCLSIVPVEQHLERLAFWMMGESQFTDRYLAGVNHATGASLKDAPVISKYQQGRNGDR